MVNDRGHRLAFRTVINIDPHLLESHEWPHADSTHDQGVCLTLVEQIDRRLTPALVVGRILHHGNIADFSVFDAYQGKSIAMAEVA